MSPGAGLAVGAGAGVLGGLALGSMMGGGHGTNETVYNDNSVTNNYDQGGGGDGGMGGGYDGGGGFDGGGMDM